MEFIKFIKTGYEDKWDILQYSTTIRNLHSKGKERKEKKRKEKKRKERKRKEKKRRGRRYGKNEKLNPNKIQIKK